MVRFYRSFLMGLGALCVLQTGTASLAESLDIQPITLEIISDPSSDSSSGAELILAAIAATSSAAPVIEGMLVVSVDMIQAAVPISDELPQPSVILGFIASGQEALFGLSRLLPMTVAGIIFSLDDLIAREALRLSDPDMFKRLIEEGHVDPNPTQLNRVLQVELKRMNCYRSSIDGAWGRGSRGSVDEYFDQLNNVSWEDPAPSIKLFRAVLLNGDVTCTAPVAVQRTQSSSSTRSTAAPTEVTKPAVNKKPTITLGVGSGVFR